MGRRSQGPIPAEILIGLRKRLQSLPPRSAVRREAVESTARLFDVSASTVYRALQALHRPKSLRRADHGRARSMSDEDLNRYCEIVAALKLRTSNRKGRRLSTNRAIELLEDHGVETPDGLVRVPKGLLKRSTLNRWMARLELDHARIIRPSAAVRFEARHSNECWQFDMSPSDLKRIARPAWVEPGRGEPTLMLFSVIDDRSGAAYLEYRCVYGEDPESALRFLYNAMAPKEGPALQGIPKMLYLDNGPVAKSLVFGAVMAQLGVDWNTHRPAGSDGFTPTARAKGKVERPFKTVKEMHETLYHFHKPETETEANEWLRNYVDRYNERPHRREPHSRIEDWIANIPDDGLREMCSWERFCAFAREPERRRVGADARISVQGTYYEVDPDLAGEEVMLWWGLFDRELYVEHNDRRYGPYSPSGGPIPLHRYRKRRKSEKQRRVDSVVDLAACISLPKSALAGEDEARQTAEIIPLLATPFRDRDPWQEWSYAGELAARRAISRQLGRPLAELSDEARTFIADLVGRTLNKVEIEEAIRDRFLRRTGGKNAHLAD